MKLSLDAFDIPKEWTDLNAVVGLPVGTPLFLQNLGLPQDVINLAYSDAEPPADFAGQYIKQIEPILAVAEGSPRVWVRLYRYDRDQLKNRVAKLQVIQCTEPSISKMFDSVRSAFGVSIVTEPLKPVVQLKFDLNQVDEISFFGAGDSDGYAANGMLTVESGTGPGSFHAAVSNRTVIYRAGTGIEFKGTGLFDLPLPGTSQYVGLIGVTDSLLFGYNSQEEFGVLRAHHGECHIEGLVISNGTGVGGETASVTIDGIVYSVNLAGGLTIQEVATAVSESLSDQADNWTFDAVNETVLAINVFVTDPINVGSFDYVGVTSAGAWTELQEGFDSTAEFIAIENWNIRPDFPMNPQGLTPLRITAQDLANGAIKYQVEMTETGDFDDTHIIRYSGTAQEPSLRSPSFRVGVVAINTDGISNSVMVRTATLEGAIQGEINFDAPSKSEITVSGAIDSTATNLLTVRNREEFADTKSLSEIELGIVNVTSESTKSSTLRVIKNAKTVTPLVYDYKDEESSLALISTTPAAVDILSGEQISAKPFVTASGELNLGALKQFLAAGESVTLAGNITSGAASIFSASLSWFEDK